MDCLNCGCPLIKGMIALVHPYPSNDHPCPKSATNFYSLQQEIVHVQVAF